MKLCILFPGIGYTCDKPLMYYTSKMAARLGYEVKRLSFSGFEKGTKGDMEKMLSAEEHAFRQSEEQLKDTDLSVYDRIVLVGKSIGTAAAVMYREKHGICASGIMYTPLSFTFDHPVNDCVFFHGTSDPWADTSEIRRLCSENGVLCRYYENADHSLETGDISVDLVNLSDVLKTAEGLLR